MKTPNAKSVEIIVNCKNLNETLELFTNQLGFRLEMISPADSPNVAVVSGHGKVLCLCEDGGIEPFHWNNSELEIPEGTNEFVVTKLAGENSWNEGRAGMLYRDLIPNRLGGRFIASHIRIPVGGEVPDYVHFHKVRFQMIFCLSGWARLVYENQGEPFLMNAGDSVLQPPEIRHCVLESSDEFEVLEIGCPAIHETFAEHEMILPNDLFEPETIFNGQNFVHHIAKKALWEESEIENIESCDTGIFDATIGLADVTVWRALEDSLFTENHKGDFLFFYIRKGNLKLSKNHQLEAGDCFVIPSENEFEIVAAKGLELIRIFVR